MDGTGVWTSVSAPYVTPGKASSGDTWAEEARQHGRTGTQRLVEVTTVIPPARVVAALAVAPDEQVVVRRRLILLDDQPVELTDSYYPLSIAGGTPLAEHRRIRSGAITLLSELGYPPRRVHEDVSCRPALPEEQNSLALNDQEWVIVLFRLVLANGDVPIEVSIMTMTANGRHLQYEMSV
jgi:DNA-binding GntR family transcriptional regulator